MRVPVAPARAKVGCLRLVIDGCRCAARCPWTSAACAASAILNMDIYQYLRQEGSYVSIVAGGLILPWGLLPWARCPWADHTVYPLRHDHDHGRERGAHRTVCGVRAAGVWPGPGGLWSLPEVPGYGRRWWSPYRTSCRALPEVVVSGRKGELRPEVEVVEWKELETARAQEPVTVKTRVSGRQCYSHCNGYVHLLEISVDAITVEIMRLERALANGPVRRIRADELAGRPATRADIEQAERYTLRLAYLTRANDKK